jgi:hypothetical protein
VSRRSSSHPGVREPFQLCILTPIAERTTLYSRPPLAVLRRLLLGWLPLRGFPLQPIGERTVPRIFNVSRKSIGVVMVECLDYEFKLVVRDSSFIP